MKHEIATIFNEAYRDWAWVCECGCGSEDVYTAKRSALAAGKRHAKKGRAEARGKKR